MTHPEMPAGHKLFESTIRWGLEPRNLLLLVDQAFAAVYSSETGRQFWSVTEQVGPWHGMPSGTLCFRLMHHSPGRPESERGPGSPPTTVYLRCGAGLQRDPQGIWRSFLLLGLEDSERWYGDRVELAALATMRRLSYFFRQRNLLPPNANPNDLPFRLAAGVTSSSCFQQYSNPRLSQIERMKLEVLINLWGGGVQDLL